MTFAAITASRFSRQTNISISLIEFEPPAKRKPIVDPLLGKEPTQT
jgi:hypothetical protein